ncbi:MAG TPA: hypothetical protein VFP84_20945 [Kofleriaceae bacterium]|nr:hypothetical protein [Kofleriaceae bacterium]
MRIACVHVPQFALQCLTRIDPALRGAAVAVVGAGSEPAPGTRPSAALHSPIVLACSRAAWTLGVRIGMTASAARFVSPDVHVVMADPQLERETVRAIADAMLGVSSVVDVGGRVAAAGAGAHWAMYCEVPSKTRGTSFGDRLLALLDDFGITGRVGIADDRFTAWVAAAHSGAEVGVGARQGAGHRGAGGVGSNQVAYAARPAGRRGGGSGQAQGAVREHAARPTGGPGRGPGGRDGAGVSAEASAALREMAPRTGISASAAAAGKSAPRDERGVVSVPRGGSAAFLAPRPLSLLAITPEVQHMLESLGVRTLGEFAALPAPTAARPLEADFRALARGDSGSNLRPYAPDAAICEALAVGSSAATLFGSAAAVTAIAQRLALRLAGRSRLATRFEITVMRGGTERVLPVTADRPVGQPSELIEVIAAAIGEGPIAKLRVVVTGEAIAGDASGAEADITEPLVDALSAALSSTGTAMPLLAPLGHLAPLAVPGASQPWQLSAAELRSERRDAHRRTRRARSRRRIAPVQPPLFNKGEG